MEVIGAGFGRTGTVSIQAALEELGFGPCYHMFECVSDENCDAPKWLRVEAAMRAEDTETTATELQAIMQGEGRKQYRSTVDFPACVYFEQLLALNPRAKVLLSVRDTPDAWYKSASETIGSRSCDRLQRLLALVTRSVAQMPAMVDAVIWDNPRLFAGGFRRSKGEEAKQVYTKWIAHVKAVVPAEQLLVYNAKQGWAPLCDFLGVPVPQVPFPNKNDSVRFKRTLRTFDAALYGTAAALVVTAAIALMRLWR